MADEVLAPCASAPTMPAVAAANAKHMAYIHECVEGIKAHPIMHDVMTSDAVAGKYVPVNWKSVQSTLRANSGPKTQSQTYLSLQTYLLLVKF